MLRRMLEEDSFDGEVNYPDEFLAEGTYEGKPENVMEGFKVFQKRHVVSNTVLQLSLVILAIISQVLAIMSDSDGNIQMNVMLIVICVFLGIWIISRPINTRKNLQKGIESLKGTIYKAEIYTDKIKISTIYDPIVENDEKSEEIETKEKEEENKDNEEDGEIPATIIHLNNAGVEITETEKLFIVYVKKINLFVIPKSAFSDDDVKKIKEKFELLLGIRFKPFYEK